MNNNQILKNDEQTDRNEQTTAIDVQSNSQHESPENSSGMKCKNGVCLVNWKPQRPAAA